MEEEFANIEDIYEFSRSGALAGGPGEAGCVLIQSLEPHRALSQLAHGLSTHWAGVTMESEDTDEAQIWGQVQTSGCVRRGRG